MTSCFHTGEYFTPEYALALLWNQEDKIVHGAAELPRDLRMSILLGTPCLHVHYPDELYHVLKYSMFLASRIPNDNVCWFDPEVYHPGVWQVVGEIIDRESSFYAESDPEFWLPLVILTTDNVAELERRLALLNATTQDRKNLLVAFRIVAQFQKPIPLMQWVVRQYSAVYPAGLFGILRELTQWTCVNMYDPNHDNTPYVEIVLDEIATLKIRDRGPRVTIYDLVFPELLARIRDDPRIPDSVRHHYEIQGDEECVLHVVEPQFGRIYCQGFNGNAEDLLYLLERANKEEIAWFCCQDFQLSSTLLASISPERLQFLQDCGLFHKHPNLLRYIVTDPREIWFRRERSESCSYWLRNHPIFTCAMGSEKKVYWRVDNILPDGVFQNDFLLMLFGDLSERDDSVTFLAPDAEMIEMPARPEDLSMVKLCVSPTGQSVRDDSVDHEISREAWLDIQSTRNHYSPSSKKSARS